jgi:hypothetical protein
LHADISFQDFTPSSPPLILFYFFRVLQSSVMQLQSVNQPKLSSQELFTRLLASHVAVGSVNSLCLSPFATGK